MKKMRACRTTMGRFAWLALVIFACAACSAPRTATSEALPTESETWTPAPTDSFTPTPPITPTPTATPTPSSLSPDAIFEEVGPSLAYIQTAGGTGTGILLAGGYVLTNAHVMLPYEKARITFPDRSEFDDVPVYNLDLLVDLCLLGPISTTLPSLTFSDREDLVIGEEVYLLGYPGEVEQYPRPTISKGLVSRIREWEPMDLTFFQTDAAVAGGQSGGVLISKTGEILGISTFAFAERQFALVTSAKDVEPLLADLLAGKDTDGLAWPASDSSEPAQEHAFRFPSGMDVQAFQFTAPLGTQLEFTISKKGGVIPSSEDYGVFSPQGVPLLDGTIEDTGVRDKLTITEEGPHFLVIIPTNQRSADWDFTVTSNVPLSKSPDNLTFDPMLKIGDTITATIDFPADIDLYKLYLHKGDRVHISTSSLLVDTSLFIDSLNEPFPQESPVMDMDSGGGMLGTDAALSFEAPKTDVYLVGVYTWLSDYGGYVLDVREFTQGDPTPIVPKPTPSAILSPVGPMKQYTSKTAPYYSLLYPADWITEMDELPPMLQDICPMVDLCASGYGGLVLLILDEEDLSILGSQVSLEKYVEVSTQMAESQGSVLIDRQKRENANGLMVELLTWEPPTGGVTIRKLMHVQDNKGFNLSFLLFTPSDASAELWGEMLAEIMDEEEIERLIEYCFDSVNVEGQGR